VGELLPVDATKFVAPTDIPKDSLTVGLLLTAGVDEKARRPFLRPRFTGC
jgi:hypothetical protein